VIPGYESTHVEQARKLWQKGWGRELGYKRFKAYLSSIPCYSRELDAGDMRFPLLILVDARISIVKTCELLSVKCEEADDAFEDFDAKLARTEKIYWIRMQDGKKNRNKSIQACREEFAGDECGLTVHEGLALYAQIRNDFRGMGMELTDSVSRKDHSWAASLCWCSSRRPALSWGFVNSALPIYGSGSRRK
jgi:hypothetical protein